MMAIPFYYLVSSQLDAVHLAVIEIHEVWSSLSGNQDLILLQRPLQ